MELKKLSWLLRALLVLAGLALVMRLRLDLYDLRVVFSNLRNDPYEAALHQRSFVSSILLCLAHLAPFPALIAAWGIFRQVGLGRGFYQEKRLRALAMLSGLETVLLAASDVMMLSFRTDRLGGGFLWGLPRMLDGTMLLYLGLTLGCGALTAVVLALSRSAGRAAALADENALTI